MARIPDMANSFDVTRSAPDRIETTDVPLSGSRSQSVQRLQIGIGGVVLMVLLVGLASLIQDRTREVDAEAVPAAAPTTEPTAAASQNDPLVNAGVVPDLPAQSQPSSSQSPAVVPEQGVQDDTQGEP